MKNILNKITIISENLSNKSNIIKNKIKNDLISIEEYNNLTNKINELKSKHFPDLVSLGILPKQISEFTNEDIGTIVLIPYNDSSEKILLNNGCIEFEVVGVNHHKDINDESKPTITLMTKNIIRQAAFDAKEPNNPLYDEIYGGNGRAECGNNRWSVSNIRQWLNSDDAANKWFTKQHEYDEAPTADKVYNEAGAYADEPGFLAGFSDEIKQHFATIKNKTILCNADKELLLKDFEETEDKVFLPSYTEMGYENLDDNNPEGNHLIQRFLYDESRIKSGANNLYWMRSSLLESTAAVFFVQVYGQDNIKQSCSDNGITPLLVLC